MKTATTYTPVADQLVVRQVRNYTLAKFAAPNMRPVIVSPDSKRVILPYDENISQYIPEVRRKTLPSGKTVMSVPHTLDSTRILRNCGYAVPAPIQLYYDWPGQFKPAEPQKQAAAFMTLHDRCFNLSELGTGKSITTLWAADWLMKQGIVKKAFIICPLSVMEASWVREIMTHMPHRRWVVLHGPRSQRIMQLKEDVDFYVINHHGVRIVGEYMHDRTDINLIVIDELGQVCRNMRTDMWRSFNMIANQQVPRMVWGLTGTPIPTAPTDAYAQIKLVKPSAVSGISYGRFKHRTMIQVTSCRWEPREDAHQIVASFMQPAIRVHRSDIMDLPPVIRESRYVQLTPEQKKAYEQMMKELRVQAARGEITAANEGVKRIKLLQILCGILYDAEHGVELIGAAPRIDETLNIIEQAEAKVIVMVPFVEACKYVYNEISKKYNTALIYGDVSRRERLEIVNRFQQCEDLRVLVAQPSTISHGLTLTAANIVVWFAPYQSNDVTNQANGRVTRPGQTRTTYIIEISASKLEQAVYNRLAAQQSMQGLLLDYIRGETDG